MTACRKPHKTRRETAKREAGKKKATKRSAICRKRFMRANGPTFLMTSGTAGELSTNKKTKGVQVVSRRHLATHTPPNDKHG